MHKHKKSDASMKKYILIIIIGISLSIIPLNKRKNTQDFKVIHSFKMVSGGYIDTSISVIITAKKYDAEKIFNEIIVFHNTLNEEPDKLTIYLYNSKEDFKNHNYINYKIYYKERR